MPNFTAKTFEWVAEGIIDDTQAEALISYERKRTQEPRTSYLVEALIYLGAVLALVAVAVIFGESWEELATSAKLGLIGLVGIGFLATGMFFHRSHEPVFGRLASFLWALGAGVASLWSGLFADLVLEVPSETVALVAAITGLIVGLTLYVLSRRTLQLVVLALATSAVASSVLLYLNQDTPTLGLAIWGLGVAWMLLAWGEQLPPRTSAFVLASLMILVAPGFLIASFWWGELFAVACAVGLIGVGIMLRQLVLLGLGGVGVFIYVPMALFEYFGDVIGVPVGLLITSVLLIGTALMLLRLGSRFRSAMVSEVARPAQVEGLPVEEPPAEGPQLEEAS